MGTVYGSVTGIMIGVVLALIVFKEDKKEE